MLLLLLDFPTKTTVSGSLLTLVNDSSLLGKLPQLPIRETAYLEGDEEEVDIRPREPGEILWLISLL